MYLEAAWIGTTALSLVGLGIVGCCCPDQQQQQQQSITVVGDNNEPKRICPDCGMENPQSASFCGDCGFSFKPTDNESKNDDIAGGISDE